MSSIGLNREMNIEAKVRLVSKGNDEPVTGNEFSVRLYDKDIFNDDFLGESLLDHTGVARFTFTKNEYSKPANLDTEPDFYFVVYKNGSEIFKSKVMTNPDLSSLEHFVMKEGEVIDLGTFLIDVPNN